MAPTGLRFPTDVPVLTDGVVTLRAHRDGDVDAMVQMCRDEQMQRWTSVPSDYTRSHAQGFVREVMAVGWEQRGHRGWAIEATDDAGVDRFAGNVDVRGTPIADIGYALHPWARGRGLMTRAIRLATQWCFQEGGVEIVHWRAHVSNVASLRTAWATGFDLHGTTPGLLFERGVVLDAWTGSLRFGADGRPTTTWWDCPTIEDDGVRLRPFVEQDAARVTQACRDESTRHWLPFLADPYTEPVARRFIGQRAWQRATGDGVTWCVADPRTDEMLANVAVMHMGGLDRGAGEIGYWSHPDARGRGVMKKAVRLAIRHAFTPVDQGGLGRRRLELLAASGNAPSNAIARAAGFTHVGTNRLAERLGDGSYDDLHVYDLLP